MHKLNVELRDKNRDSNYQLRKRGLIPAVYYHHGEPSISLSVSEKELKKMFSSHASVVKLSNGKMSILKNVDKDPFGKIMHLNFEGVVAGEKFHRKIPVKVTFNPEISAWHKEGRLLRHHLDEIEIETTPESVPEFIEIDVTDFDPHSVLRVKDLQVAGYKIISEPESEIASFGFPHVVKESEAAPEQPEPEQPTSGNPEPN